MSQVLANLLSKPKEDVANWLAVLEHKAGYPRHDIRMVADNAARVRQKIASLGLDPTDTTDEELYHSLLSKYASDCSVIDRALGMGPESSFEDRQKAAAQLLNHLTKDASVWAPKPTALKRIIQAQPPKKLMKAWNYRSVVSLIKREDPAGIVAAAFMLESPAWQKSFKAKLSRLSDTDYCIQPVHLLHLKSFKGTVSAKEIVAEPLVGAVGICQGAKFMNAPVLSMILALIEEIEKMCVRLDTRSLASLNPVLGWWADTAHLFWPSTDRHISLNIHDVSDNHLRSASFGEHGLEHAGAAFLSTLVEKYKEQMDEIPAEIEKLNQGLSDEAAKLTQPVRGLAFEAVEG